VFYDPKYEALITLTSYSSLKILTDFGKTFYFEEVFNDSKITCIAFSAKQGCILLGTILGRILVYNWPLFGPGKEDLNGCYEICVDNTHIDEILFSTCETYVFIGTDNGNIYCFEC
jgi:hypothetical protein